MKEIEFIKSMEALELRDGDILCVRVDGNLDSLTLQRIKEYTKSQLPEEIKDVGVYVLDHGIDMGVIRKEKE